MFNFLNSKIRGFGIDLSDLSIKIVNLEKTGGKLSLASFGRQEIPPGLIEEGEIKKEEELIGVIKKAIGEVKGAALKTRYCVVSLPETESFVRVVHLPLMKKEEAAEAIKWEIEANIPLGLNEIYYDWQIIEPAPAERSQRQQLDVLIGVLPKKTVDPYLDALKKAGLKPFVFEIESLAITRALIPNGCCQEPVMIIDFGAKRTSLAIFSGQIVYFTASLPLSNSSLIATLSEKLAVDPTKARQLKIEQGLDYKNPQSLIFQALQPTLKESVDKIKGYIDYYQEHVAAAPGTQSNKINKIFICGGGANFAGLAEWLAQELKLEVVLGNPWVNVLKYAPANLPTNESLSYTTAIGLALRGLRE